MDLGNTDVAVEQVWRDHRRHVLDIAFRMLGNLSEAEDVVQEGFARLIRADIDDINDVRGWLVVVVSRLCLDRLRSGKRHPTSSTLSLEERPAAVPGDPADRVTLDDGIRIALQMVLERLTAAERTAFVLHDVFQYSFDEIAEIVGRTPTACRQLASRARRTVRTETGPGRFAVEPVEHRLVTERFIAACTSGDVEALVAVLDPNVTGDADVAAEPVEGRDGIAAGAMSYLGPQSGTTLLSLPYGGDVMIVVLRKDRVVAIVTLTIEGDHVTHIHARAKAAQLAPLRAVLDG